MDGTAFQFEVGTRVKLRDGIDPTCYGGMAKVGNEGWIAGHRRDRFGLPEVYVRWDPNHWAYNRQPDTWTFQEHFDPVEETRPVSDARAEAARQAATEFADRMAAIFATDAPAPDTNTEASAPVDPERLAKEQRFAQYVEEATMAMIESEAFICLTVTRKSDERASQGALVTDAIGDSLTPDSEAVLGSQLSALGAQFHRNLAALHAYTLAEKREQGDGSIED